MTKTWNLLGLLLANTLGCSVYSIVAPYLPDEAKKKEITSGTVGLMLSGYPVAALFTSFFLGKYIGSIGRTRVILLGCILESISTLAYSSLPSASYTMFMLLGFSLRVVQGVGCGCLATATLAIITSEYRDKLQECLGLMQISFGIGFMLGPLGASALYTLGGFTTIFISYGVIFAAMCPLLYFVFRTDKPAVVRTNGISLLESVQELDISLHVLVLACTTITACFTFPTLSAHLSSFDIPEALFGVMFAIPTVSYIGSTVLVIKSPYSKRTTLVLGMAVLVLCNLVIGPWRYTFLPRSIVWCVIGLVMVGLGVCACGLTAMPIIIELAQARFSNRDKELVSDAMSGLANSVYFVAEIIAPPLSGFLSDNYGFESTQALLAAGLLLLLLGLVARYITEPREKEKGEELTELQVSLT